MQDPVKFNSKDVVIQTIRISEDSAISFCTERGGIITSLVLQGKEILYLDKETFEDTEKNVRGGIPILFPNAGAFESTQFPLLGQHGFARNSSKWISQTTLNGFTESLSSDEESKKMYLYDFQLSVEGKFENDGSFTLIQKVENNDKKNMLPIAMGLHPYFKVENDKKKNIQFNFEGGKYIEEQFYNWSEGNFISIDNPKIHNPQAVMNIVLPNVGTLMIDASVEYKKIWIWSLPGENFICIEPVMRDVQGLVNDPELLMPNAVFSGSVNFNLK